MSDAAENRPDIAEAPQPPGANDSADRNAALAAMYERGIVGIGEVDSRSRRFVRVNRRYCEMVRRSEAQLLTQGPRDLLLPEDCQEFETQWKAAAAGPGFWQGRVRHVLGDGEIAWMQIGISICARDENGAPLRSVSVIQDVTESVVALEELKFSEEKLRLGQRVGGIATFVRDLKTGAVAANAESRAMLGLPQGDADFPIEVWSAVIIDEDRPRVTAIMAATVARHESEVAYQFRVRRPGESEVRHFEMRAHYSYDEQGLPLHSVGVAIDVTENMRAAEKLRISEEMRRLGQEVGKMATFAYDLVSGEMTVTPESRALVGLPAGDVAVTFRDWLHLLVPEDRKGLTAAISGALARREENLGFKYRLLPQNNGETRFIEMRARNFYDAQGRPLRSVGVSIDVT